MSDRTRYGFTAMIRDAQEPAHDDLGTQAQQRALAAFLGTMMALAEEGARLHELMARAAADGRDTVTIKFAPDPPRSH